jgi:uncharacterized protein
MTQEELIREIQEVAPRLPHCERIKKISLFGSYLHGDAKEDSDVDLLIEISRPFTYFDLAEVQIQLEETLGKDVDLATSDSLSKYIRENVIQESILVYEA